MNELRPDCIDEADLAGDCCLLHKRNSCKETTNSSAGTSIRGLKTDSFLKKLKIDPIEQDFCEEKKPKAPHPHPKNKYSGPVTDENIEKNLYFNFGNKST